jgi:antirestriction protein ArdC
MGTYEDVTNRIVQAIETGAVRPDGWKMPWHTTGGGRPVNVLTGRTYTGVNTLNLWLDMQQKGYTSPVWGTLRQWNEQGAKVRKGEKSSLVVFWKDLPKKEVAEGEDAGKRFVLKTSYAFNAAQVEGYEQPAPVRDWEPCAADNLIAAAGIEINFGGHRAYYHQVLDSIQMPYRSDFFTVAGFQSTLLHEAAHWTGHSKRLAREFGKRFGDQAYAFEELVAELAAAFLCADLVVSNEPRDDHAWYAANWLRVLKSDPRAIFTAASQASKAAEYLLGFTVEKTKKQAA